MAPDKSLAAEIEAVIKDPVAVHLNMLRGTIAKPSIENIIHLYGRDALLAALQSRAFEDGARWMREQAESRADIWLTIWGEREIRHTSARQYACGAIEDVKDAIAAIPLQPEGERNA